MFCHSVILVPYFVLLLFIVIKIYFHVLCIVTVDFKWLCDSLLRCSLSFRGRCVCCWFGDALCSFTSLTSFLGGSGGASHLPEPGNRESRGAAVPAGVNTSLVLV